MKQLSNHHLFTFLIFSVLILLFIRLFYRCPNFKHSYWWRHKVGRA